MKTIILLLLTLASLIASTGSFAAGPAKSIVVYKSPTCGCCTKWEDHLRANGFKVKSEKVDDMAVIKRKHQVPSELSSCHTALIDGYVIEGHVPADSIVKLLKERPKGSKGLAVPGMPMGSPGMEQGGVTEHYSILSFDKTGKTTVFDQR